MCLAVPGKVEVINDQGPMLMAKVDFSGIKKDICIDWVPDVKVGDYVVVHAGFAINVLDKDEAEENLKMIEEVANTPGAYSKW